MSVLDTLKAATPARRTVTLCLDAGLQAEWDALLDDLQDAANKDAKQGLGNLANPTPLTTAVIDQQDAIRDRMKASEVTFAFQQMPWSKRIGLQADHPPRNDSPLDRIRGFNIETFYPALIKASCASVAGVDGVEVTDIPDETWVHLLGDDDHPGSLNLRGVQALSSAAEGVNDRETSVPPSARSLLGSQDSGASLAQPSPGTSAPSDSEAGNPPGSAKSTTGTTKARTRAGSAES